MSSDNFHQSFSPLVFLTNACSMYLWALPKKIANWTHTSRLQPCSCLLALSRQLDRFHPTATECDWSDTSFNERCMLRELAYGCKIISRACLKVTAASITIQRALRAYLGWKACVFLRLNHRAKERRSVDPGFL